MPISWNCSILLCLKVSGVGLIHNLEKRKIFFTCHRQGLTEKGKEGTTSRMPSNFNTPWQQAILPSIQLMMSDALRLYAELRFVSCRILYVW